MLNKGEIENKGKYKNEFGIVFNNRNFYEKSFDF